MKKQSRDVLITGASGALGGALARRFSRMGYKLHLTSRQPARLNTLKKELERLQSPVEIYRLELSNPSQCASVVQRFFSKAAHPSCLICNAGNLGVIDRFRSASFREWSVSIMENFMGQAAMIHAFAQCFSKHRLKQGTIITLSGAGLGADTIFDRLSSYSTAKAALTHLVEALAPEFKELGLTINAIAPGQIRSSITQQALDAGAKAGPYAQSARQCAETGGVSPELAADLVEFLTGPKGRVISGRLLSARFDRPALEKNLKAIANDSNLYRLRRIDNDRFEAKPR